MIGLHADKLLAQAAAIALVNPFNFPGSKLGAFGRTDTVRRC